MSEMSEESRNAVLGAFGLRVSVDTTPPFSRKHESEADKLGMLLAADAGYDPRAAIGLWERIAQNSHSGRQAEILSIHPHEPSRIERMQKYIPKALGIYARAKRAGR